MSLTQVRNVVLLFSNPVWSGANTVPTTIIRNITALSSQFAYKDTIDFNITTLTTTNANILNGVIQGLLYVPDLPYGHPCQDKQNDLVPLNVTRQANLPPTNYNLIGLAPWFNATCTQAYFAAARLDPVRAFIFYRPNNSTNKPQPVDSPVWDLDDGGAWVTENHFPVFAIPGRDGHDLMQELARYSGNVSQVPYGPELIKGMDTNPNDYVRIWTELKMRDPENMPAMWTYFLTVAGATLFLIICISLGMHMVQRRRRASLRERIIMGEVDLEAMGIKRLMVPVDHVRGFPLFTYSYDPEISSAPLTPSTSRSPRSPRSPRRPERTYSSDLASPTSRSHRPSMSSTFSIEATNFQPSCHICLELFEHRASVIRELPCQHIFHPECIDEFLSKNSSLCPICKRSMLPRGHCPRITNGIVRRERAIRRLRERVLIEDSESDKAKNKSWGARIFGTGVPETLPTSRSISLAPVDSSPKYPRTPRTPRTPSLPPVLSPVSTTMATVPELPSPVDSPPPDTLPSTPPPATLAPESHATQSPPPEVQQPSTPSPRRSRRPRPRALQLRPAAPDVVKAAQLPGAQRNPTDQTRARMRTLAGLPFEDLDSRRSLWNKTLVKIFPGFS